jgi:hypothetical protein
MWTGKPASLSSGTLFSDSRKEGETFAWNHAIAKAAFDATIGAGQSSQGFG